MFLESWLIHLCHAVSGHATSLMSPHVSAPQNKYKTSVKKKAERQILAVKPSATEEELSAVFEQEVRHLRCAVLYGPVA